MNIIMMMMMFIVLDRYVMTLMITYFCSVCLTEQLQLQCYILTSWVCLCVCCTAV